MVFFIVCVRSGNSKPLQNTAFDMPLDDEEVTFCDLFNKIKKTQLNLKDVHEDGIINIRIKQSKSDDGVLISSSAMKLSVCKTLNSHFVEYEIDCNNNSVNSDNNKLEGENAFSVLMKSQTTYKQPLKPQKEKLSAPEKLLCDVIDWVAKYDMGWTPETSETGQTVVKTLSNALWFIDHCHKKFEDNGCRVPKQFKHFQGYNNFAKFHHRAPVITSEKLNDHCLNLNKCLGFPSMTTEKHKTLAGHLEDLLSCLTKYKIRLDKDNARHKTVYHNRSEDECRSVEKDSTCYFVTPVPVVQDIYKSLDKALKKGGDYKYIDLDQFTPRERGQRRKYIKDLHLTRPVMIFRMAYGGNVGTLNFLWGVTNENVPANTTKNAKITAEIMKSLPKFSTRAMRRDFINKYAKHVKTPKSLLRHMYHELTQTESQDENDEQKMLNERVAEILLESDDPQLLLDYRELNGKSVNEKYNIFFDEMGKYFEKQLLPVNERRHGNELYLPLAISVEDLKSQVTKQCPPGTPIPSSETIRLQFMPGNPFQKTALRYTGRFNVKFRVQTRQARLYHPDGRYVATMFRYLKQFCVRFREESLFICLDDKAIVPVGDPGVPISTGVRGHNKVMTPASGPELVAADHDFHVAGLVPSVVLVTETPSSSNDSFFTGKVYVTTKDKVFQPSHPFRHATELIRILREHHSSDNVNLEVPILCMMTDGGPDHRVTYESVKASLVQLFMQLDLDMLIAIRTAPNQSWVNPAERCMSILNLALQHVALSREKMSDEMEKNIKYKTSLNAIRNATTKTQELKQAFGDSMQSVIATVNDRFSRMKLKGAPFTTYTGASAEDIEDSLKILCDTTGANPSKIHSSATSKEIKTSKEFQDFIKIHGESNHYSFQLKKCQGENLCQYCTICPSRLQRRLQFLPCPVPDEGGQHYRDFNELYGKDIDGSHRPSAKTTSVFDDESVECDLRNRDILKAVKARDAISCSECARPRVVYSAVKMTREQDAALRRLREENSYTCGDSVEEYGLVTKRALSCTSEIELTYYGQGVRSYLPPCCIYCGQTETLLDDTDPYIAKLFENYSCVRPLCTGCRASGKDAKTWGRKFFKRQKRC